MKIDLCKIFGVEEGEEFKINEDIDFIYRVHNNKLQYLYDYEKKIWHKASDPINNFVEDFKITKLPKRKEFTDDELAIMRSTPNIFKWMARDKDDNEMCLFERNPEKDENGNWNARGSWYILTVFKHLFKTITSEDEEPVFIDDYVER